MENYNEKYMKGTPSYVRFEVIAINTNTYL